MLTFRAVARLQARRRRMTGGGDLARIWVYLAETPLLWLTATLVAYVIGDAVSARLAPASARQPGGDRRRPADRAC